MSSLCRFHGSIIAPVHQTQRIVKQFKCPGSLVAQTKQFKLRNSTRSLFISAGFAVATPSAANTAVLS